MAQAVYQGLHDDIIGGSLTSSADLRLMAVMSNTTTDTETDAQTLSDFTTIDECDGVGYAQADLASLSVAYNASTDKLVIDADDCDLDGGSDIIAVSTRQVTRLLFYRYVDGTDANDVPWFSIDVGPFTLSGGPFDVQFNTTGIATVG